MSALMNTPERIRNWMMIKTREIPVARAFACRPATIEDAAILGRLMDRAYTGTIDHEGETPDQCEAEMRGTMLDKYGPFLDFASFIITESGQALSASLVTYWKEKPLLAFSMSDPSAQGKGYAGFLIERSIAALAARGYPELYLVVTEGNSPAEHLYRKLGFSFLGAALPKQASPSG